MMNSDDFSPKDDVVIRDANEYTSRLYSSIMQKWRGGEITVTPELITYDRALQLKKDVSERNRRPVGTASDEYADSLRRCQWDFNGETIVIDDNGGVINGQNRLDGIIKSHVSMVALVVRGVPTSAFETIDTGRRRTSANILQIDKVRYSATVSAAIKLLHCQLQGYALSNSNATCPPARTRELLGKYPEFEINVPLAKNDLLPGAPSTFLYTVLCSIDQHLADEFFEGLRTGQNLNVTHPVWVLRESIMRARASRNKPKTHTLTAYAIKAVNAFVEGKGIKRLNFAPAKEEYPILRCVPQAFIQRAVTVVDNRGKSNRVA